MPDDVIVNKCEIIERCLERVSQIYANNPNNLKVDQLRQDAILLNLERACQATIDLGMRWVRLRSLGVPKESRDVFTFLEAAHHISGDLANSLKKMVGFRNIAVHDYQALNLEVIQKLIESDFKDIKAFIRLALQTSQAASQVRDSDR